MGCGSSSSASQPGPVKNWRVEDEHDVGRDGAVHNSARVHPAPSDVPPARAADGSERGRGENADAVLEWVEQEALEAEAEAKEAAAAKAREAVRAAEKAHAERLERLERRSAARAAAAAARPTTMASCAFPRTCCRACSAASASSPAPSRRAWAA